MTAMETKYRAKGKITGGWLYGDKLTDQISGTAAIVTYVNLSGNVTDLSEINIYAVIPKTLGRFTGHTDKKGKEIFEGDIVVWDYDTSDFDDSTYTPELVKWNDEVAGFADEYGAYWDKNYKIIGNIHDNPELLKDN